MKYGTSNRLPFKLVSNRLGRKTYGIWGASRFSALKQPIRAKYNSINNRVALEDSLTKQYITIGMEAVAHIQDPAEQQERLKSIMNDVAKLLETIDGDQINFTRLHRYQPC